MFSVDDLHYFMLRKSPISEIPSREKTIDVATRDYSTISPSARSLLLMKSFTNIPYANEAASLMPYSDSEKSSKLKEPGFWMRAVHFENRYWSIDQLLSDVDCRNVLEISSGYSFRGLDMVRRSAVHYIDTDLADVITSKKQLIAAFRTNGTSETGTLNLLPLNALDESQFENIVNRFPDGKVAIINEGLLMYLNDEEKRKICRNVAGALKRSGGYWITADIYVKKRITENVLLNGDEGEKQFFKRHRVEENKFESFKTAEAFFQDAGFVVEKEAQADKSKLSLLSRLLKNVTHDQLLKIQSAGKIQATWRLKLRS
jgi:O-methyltransferase involved in polyketide biosynthesis